MKKLLAIVASLGLLTSFATACSTGEKRPACADKFMAQYVDETHVQKGVYDCLSTRPIPGSSASIRTIANMHGVNSDRGLARVIGDPHDSTHNSTYRYVERNHNGYYVYEYVVNIDGKVVADKYIALAIGQDGRVQDIA